MLFAGRPSHALPPDFADLWFLYRTVRSQRPRCILEFGSGCSTLILAQALHDNRKHGGPHGRLYSIEADPFWAALTVSALPLEWRRFCEIWLSDLEEVEWAGTPAFRHARLPDCIPDLVYLDGPALTPERRVAVDVLDLENRFPTGFCLIVDGRWENTVFLRQHLKREYSFAHRPLFGNSIFLLGRVTAAGWRRGRSAVTGSGDA